MHHFVESLNSYHSFSAIHVSALRFLTYDQASITAHSQVQLDSLKQDQRLETDERYSRMLLLTRQAITPSVASANGSYLILSDTLPGHTQSLKVGEKASLRDHTRVSAHPCGCPRTCSDSKHQTPFIITMHHRKRDLPSIGPNSPNPAQNPRHSTT